MGKPRRTQEDFELEINNMFDGNIVVLGQYVNQRTRLDFYCKKCGNEWSAMPMSILQTSFGCPNCANKVLRNKLIAKNISTSGRFVDLYPELAKRFDYDKNEDINIQNLSPKSGQYIWWKCEDCGNSWQSKVATVVNSKGNCPKCYHTYAPNNIITYRLNKNGSLADHYPDLLEEWDYEKNVDITPEMVTVKSNKKVWWKCKKCGHEWEAKVSKRTEGRGCPYCYRFEKSNLQQKVQGYIEDQYGYEFLHEYDCTLKCRNPETHCLLPYDNELVISDDVRVIIECNGEQHYKICGLTKLGAKKSNTTPEDELKYIQWKDEYKKQYALSQGYYYLEIPYWTESDNSYKTLIDDKIQEILNNIKLIPSK